MKINFIDKNSSDSGVTLLITVIILSAIIVAAVGVATVFTKEIRISSLVDDSIFAIMAADAGMEKKLYDIRKLDGAVETSYSGTLSNGATYTACSLAGSCVEGSPSKVKTIGEFKGVQRSFEATF